jgi:hypothetical protein
MRLSPSTLALPLILAFAPAVTHAQASPGTWRLAPEPIFAAGRVDGPPNELFSRIVSAIRLDDGRYVVADSRENRLSVYTADGQLQTTFGQAGDGPGEVGSIRAIWHARGDTIGLWDSGLQRITHFLPDGTVGRTSQIRLDNANLPVPSAHPLDSFLGAFADGRLALSWLVSSPFVPNRLLQDRMIFGLFSAEGQFLGVLGEHEGMQRVYQPGAASGPFAFSPFPWSAVSRDTLIYTNGLNGTVLLFDADPAGANVSRVLSVPGVAKSLAVAWDELEDNIANSEVPAPIIRMTQSTDRSIGEVPQYARMFTDDAGNLWLKEFEPATDAVPLRRTRYVGGGQWRIVDMSGATIARFNPPDSVSPLAVYGDHLLGISRDTLDVERFVVYRIIR